MAQTRDFSMLSTAPTSPRVGVVGLYANASGSMVQLNASGAGLYIGGQLTGTIAAGLIATGGAGYVTTGLVFSANSSAAQTGLGQPSFFIPFLAPDNRMYGVPAYPYK